jgi:glycosyltransferase involved in cell wall biosynthesis
MSFVKKNFSLKSQGRIKILLSAYRLFLSRLRGGVYRGKNLQQNIKPRILFYDINGLSYAGTQKFEQILARHLDKSKYEVFFMYSSKMHNERRDYFAGSGVNLIDFDFNNILNELPFTVRGMRPHIFQALNEHRIDLLVVSGPGYPEFPVANITGTPIIFLNIFGSVNIQKNIKMHICISKLLAEIVKQSIPSDKIDVMYVPSDGPDEQAEERGKRLRESFGIKDDEMIFGRIGRPDDNIFDPIGIQAFKIAQKLHSGIHYIIVAPPPALTKMVENEQISNVHFINPTADEREIWAFHHAIDAMAHFRYDGETCGLNIAESMLCAKPIITHKSPIWNAHLEYIDDSFGRVAGVGDVARYADFMTEFTDLKKASRLFPLGEAARNKAVKLFSINDAMKKFEGIIQKCI